MVLKLPGRFRDCLLVVDRNWRKGYTKTKVSKRELVRSYFESVEVSNRKIVRSYFESVEGFEWEARTAFESVEGRMALVQLSNRSKRTGFFRSLPAN
jgi:hypothetical protein